VTNEEAFPGMLKIGLTKTHPASRLSSAGTWCPVGTFKLVDARLVPDCEEFEKYLHRVFAGFRVRGEWFKMSTDMAVSTLHAPMDTAA
jgi:hypothetical protein